MDEPRDQGALRAGRWMAARTEPFVVFLFGMRLNRLTSPSGLRRWLWARRVLAAALADLGAHPERGLLAGKVWRSGRELLAVQYWSSFEALDDWARDHGLPHRPAWQRYLREAMTDPALGLWHETYLAAPGTWEGVYMQVPPTGAGAAGPVLDMGATKGSARDRLRQVRRRGGNDEGEG